MHFVHGSSLVRLKIKTQKMKIWWWFGLLVLISIVSYTRAQVCPGTGDAEMCDYIDEKVKRAEDDFETKVDELREEIERKKDEILDELDISQIFKDEVGISIGAAIAIAIIVLCLPSLIIIGIVFLCCYICSCCCFSKRNANYSDAQVNVNNYQPGNSFQNTLDNDKESMGAGMSYQAEHRGASVQSPSPVSPAPAPRPQNSRFQSPSIQPIFARFRPKLRSPFSSPGKRNAPQAPSPSYYGHGGNSQSNYGQGPNRNDNDWDY